MNGDTFDWRALFGPGESPYFAMFRCGCIGVAIEECIALCEERRILLRGKDIGAWKDGDWKRRASGPQSSILNPLLKPGYENVVPIMGSRLEDFETWPPGWSGTDRRWFPCDHDNMPMQKWGYFPDFTPSLYEKDEARALSPRGWVGQNLYAQPFIVIDIDGVGHGESDEQVIEFGTRYRHFTETWENPAKPGSFHLYFATERQIPISHFPYAKLDLMGNQRNAAVYSKDKQSNGHVRAMLCEEFWQDLQSYLDTRQQQRLRAAG